MGKINFFFSPFLEKGEQKAPLHQKGYYRQLFRGKRKTPPFSFANVVRQFLFLIAPQLPSV